jgi:hypothetical protein
MQAGSLAAGATVTNIPLFTLFCGSLVSRFGLRGDEEAESGYANFVLRRELLG